MDKVTADYVVRIAFKAGSELSKLLPIVKETPKEEGDDSLEKSIFKASKMIGEEIVLKIFEMYPELQDELEVSINKFNRLP